MSYKETIQKMCSHLDVHELVFSQRATKSMSTDLVITQVFFFYNVVSTTNSGVYFFRNFLHCNVSTAYQFHSTLDVFRCHRSSWTSVIRFIFNTLSPTPKGLLQQSNTSVRDRHCTPYCLRNQVKIYEPFSQLKPS